MNTETNKLLHQLDQATSSAPVDLNTPPNTLDEETAMLRENWLALGKLLKAAESESSRIDVVELRRPEPERRKSWRFAWAGLASAAALAGLWLVVQAAFYHGVSDQEERAELPNHSQSDDHTNSVPSLVKTPVPPISGLAWDDGWDNDLAQTALALQEFHGGERARDSSFSRLQDKFQEFARDFESGSL